jgi:hypothetical protein
MSNQCTQALVLFQLSTCQTWVRMGLHCHAHHLVHTLDMFSRVPALAFHKQPKLRLSCISRMFMHACLSGQAAAAASGKPWRTTYTGGPAPHKTVDIIVTDHTVAGYPRHSLPQPSCSCGLSLATSRFAVLSACTALRALQGEAQPLSHAVQYQLVPQHQQSRPRLLSEVRVLSGPISSLDTWSHSST